MRIPRVSSRFSLVLIVLSATCGFSADSDVPDQWRLTASLGEESGARESIRVRVLREDTSVIELTYRVPSAQAVALDQDRERIFAGNAPLTGNPGQPRLPVIPARVLIPAGYEVDKTEVIAGTKIVLSGTHKIEYAENNHPLIEGIKPEAAIPDPAIYDSDTPYPAGLSTTVGVQRKRGASILYVNLHPVEYLPRSGAVASYESLTLRVTLKAAARTIERVRFRADPRQPLSTLVDNPDMVSTYTESSGDRMPFGLCNPDDQYSYVVITSTSILNSAGPYSVTNLLAHRRAQGLNATAVAVENIYTNYTGADNAERVRNFIIDAYNNWETEYVLLGGDTAVVPMRKLWCVAWTGSSYQDHIPSDLYFQCLDGTYNYDGDTYWGETTDGVSGGDVDLLAEVMIGRASAETASEMANFIYKTLAYETQEDATPYLRSALMVGEYLGFGGISDYATASMEEIRLGSSSNGYTTAGFASCDRYTVDTLYDSTSNTWYKADILARINSGQYSIFNHLGHANATYVMKFYNADADTLTNTQYSFAYSQGCIPGNFEVDCLAEHLTTSTRYGMYAVVFNARYGWGSGYSTDGPSQRFDRQFWDAYFSEQLVALGALNADSHEDNIWDIDGSCIRWCYYESNLLGDPATPMRGQSIPDAILVTPGSGFASRGLVGGPFDPSSRTYSLQCTASNQSLSWSMTCASNWVTCSPAGGTLEPGARCVVTVSVNAAAATLPEGLYNASIVMTNTSNGRGSTVRSVELLVNNPPHVISSSTQNGDVVPAGNWTLTVAFDKRLLGTVLDQTDFQLVGEVVGAVTPANYVYTSSIYTSTLSVVYSGLPEDRYTMTLLSGASHLADLYGYALDGETPSWPIPPNVSGDGTEGGNFSFVFNVDATTVAFPLPMKSKDPLGSLIYDSSASALIASGGDTDRFTVALDAGQTLTAIANPNTTLRPSIRMFNPSGASFAVTQAVAIGQEAVLQAVPVTNSGLYAVEVSGVGVSTGRYSVQVLLNAAAEGEAHDGAANDTRATAQNLQSSFIALAGSATRGAVVGQTETGASDYYRIDLTAGDSVTLALTDFVRGECSLELEDSDGVVLATAGEAVSNVSAAIENYAASRTAAYYARVRGTGDVYSLVVTRNAHFDLEPNDSMAGAQDLGDKDLVLGAVGCRAQAITQETEPNDDGVSGGSTNDLPLANDWSGSFTASSSGYLAQVTGTISAGSDVDWDFFRIEAGPGDRLVLKLNGSSLSDPYMHFYARNGVRLAYDDDSGDGLYSLITYTNFAYQGAYYVVADSYGTYTGTYTLYATLATSNRLDRQDDDYIRFEALEGDPLQVRTWTPGDATNEFVNVLNPAIELYGVTGALLAGDDNGAPDGRNALVSLNAPAGGTYTIRVRAVSGSGEYLVGLPRRLRPSEVMFSSASSFGREESGTVKVPVVLTSPTSTAVSVGYSILGGTATGGGTDYTLAQSGTVVFQPGQISTGITIQLVNDTLDEGTETIIIKLASAVNANLGEVLTNTCVIVDDERPLRLQFSPALYSIGENGTQVVMTVARSGGVDGPVTVDYATADGTALAGADYMPVAATLVIPDGASEGTFAVPIEYDTIDEDNETFTVELENATGGATLGGSDLATVTIVDYDMPRTNMLVSRDFEIPAMTGWGQAGLTGRDKWAARCGTGGVYVAGWNGMSYGCISQTVAATRGTYTFSLWARREAGYTTRQTYLKMEWLNSSKTAVRAPDIADFSGLPADGGWHQLHITATCTNLNLAYVRSVFYSAFDQSTESACGFCVDDAAFYPGLFTGACALVNGSFDMGDGNEWRGSAWYAMPERVANGRESWAGRTNSWGGALYGWDTSSNRFASVVAQNLTPGTGTYSLGIWVMREANFILTNAELRLEWFDGTFTNRVQSNSVSSLAIPADNTWHDYYVEGRCSDTNLFEIRATFFAQYELTTGFTDYRALKFDDARFAAGILDEDGDALPDSWESRYFDNPTNGAADVDSDHDGLNNWQEYVADTVPTNNRSALSIDVRALTDDHCIRFYSSANRLYTLQFSTNLFPAPNWQTIRVRVPGEGGEMELSDINGDPQGYYRLRVNLP